MSQQTATTPSVIALPEFIQDFGAGLLQAVRTQNPPIYDGSPNLLRNDLMDGLLRKPFPAQREVVQAITRLLIDEEAPASIINAEMGTGKTIMGIAAAAVMHADRKARGRRVLVYTTYTGTRDTTSRLKSILEAEGFKTAVLRASVDAVKREDWLFDQVDRGVDVVLTNPELVKTGLDMLEFPSIVFMQSGYNVYTLQQAARRSWRIGQREDVDVNFLGYAGSAQLGCLELMAKKIAVSQSTSGDMPESGLDILNQSGDSIEVALAKQLLAA